MKSEMKKKEKGNEGKRERIVEMEDTAKDEREENDKSMDESVDRKRIGMRERN